MGRTCHVRCFYGVRIPLEKYQELLESDDEFTESYDMEKVEEKLTEFFTVPVIVSLPSAESKREYFFDEARVYFLVGEKQEIEAINHDDGDVSLNYPSEDDIQAMRTICEQNLVNFNLRVWLTIENN